MSFYAYMLRCADGSCYTGQTDNLERRLASHQAGEIAGYTSVRLPVELAWSETFSSREEALGAERQIKGWSRAKKEALIERDWDKLRELSRSRGLSAHGSTSSPRTDLRAQGGSDPEPGRPELVEGLNGQTDTVVDESLSKEPRP